MTSPLAARNRPPDQADEPTHHPEVIRPVLRRVYRAGVLLNLRSLGSPRRAARPWCQAHAPSTPPPHPTCAATGSPDPSELGSAPCDLRASSGVRPASAYGRRARREQQSVAATRTSQSQHQPTDPRGRRAAAAMICSAVSELTRTWPVGATKTKDSRAWKEPSERPRIREAHGPPKPLGLRATEAPRTKRRTRGPTEVEPLVSRNPAASYSPRANPPKYHRR